MYLKTFSKWSREDKGATMIEYGIAIVVAVIVGTAGLLTMANQIDSNMRSAGQEMADTDSE